MPTTGRKATLNDADGAIYPITSTECVVDADGDNVDSLISQIKSNLEPKTITQADFITLSTGFTMERFKCQQIGRQIVCDMTIKKSSYLGDLTQFGTIKISPLSPSVLTTGCYLSTSTWSATTVGYIFWNQGQGTINIADMNGAGNKSYAHIHLHYITAT